MPTREVVLDETEFLASLEGTSPEEVVALLRKQRQAALRYKGRFSEVSQGSSRGHPGVIGL